MKRMNDPTNEQIREKRKRYNVHKLSFKDRNHIQNIASMNVYMYKNRIQAADVGVAPAAAVGRYDAQLQKSMCQSLTLIHTCVCA